MFSPLHGGAFIPTLLLLTTVESSVPALKGAEIAKLCKLSKFLATAPGDAVDKASKAITAVRAATDAHFKATLATLTAKNETAALLYAALAKVTADCLDAQVTKAANVATTSTEASTRAAATAAAVSDFVHFLKKASTNGDTTGYCLTSTTADSTIFTAVPDLSCDTLQLAFVAQPAAYESTDINNKGFPVLDGGDAKSTGSADKCILYHKGGGGASASEVFQSTAAVTLAGGTIKLTPRNGGPSANLEKHDNYNGDWQPQTGDKIKELYTAITKLKKETPTVCGSSSAEILKHAVASNKLHTELEALVKKSKMQLNGKTEADTATNIINSFLKTDGDKGDQLAAQINTAQTTISDGDTVSKGTVDKLDTTAKLIAALAIDLKTARTSALDQQTQLEAARAKLPCEGESAKKTLEDEAEENCNAKDKESDCKKPCKWDGEAKEPNKKCKLDKDAAKEAAEKAKQEGKDGKSTNTTASNSFVISKAPLLLEVSDL